MVPKESKYFVIRGARLFEMFKNFSSAAQYLVKCFRIAADDIIGARAAYSNPFEKKYKWPSDLEEDIRIFVKLRTEAFKSLQELNKNARNFEKMRKKLFQFKMHFVQHELLDLLDFLNQKIFVAQLEQRAIGYEKLEAQKKVQAEAATKAMKQASRPAVPDGQSTTQAEHHNASQAASVPPHTTNTKKESGAPIAYEQSSQSQASEAVQHTVSPTSNIAAVNHPSKVVAINPMPLRLMGKPYHNQIPSAMSLTTYRQIHQHDIAMHVTAPQSNVTGPSTTLGQYDRDQVSPITSYADVSEARQAAPANSEITDIPIDPILLSLGQSHGMPQSSTAKGVTGREICQPSPSVTFATPPRNVIAPSGPPHQPCFPDSSPNTVIMQTPRNHHGLPAFPPTTPPMKSAEPSGTSAQLRGADSSPPTEVLQMHSDSEFGLVGAAIKPHGLMVGEGYSCDYDIFEPHPMLTSNSGILRSGLQNPQSQFPIRRRLLPYQ
jgi:hypothetical protein